MSRAEAPEGGRGVGRVSTPQEPSFENLLSFAMDERTAVSIDKKVLTPPKDKHGTLVKWEQRWDITGKYIGTGMTLDEVGRDYNTTRENARQRVKTGVRQWHDIQTPEVKSDHPLSSFKYNKPLSLASRRRHSIANGGASIKVEQALAEGKSIEQIREGLTADQFYGVRATLHAWGIVEIPYIVPILQRFERLRNPDLSDEEKQEVLDSIEHNGEIRALISGEEPFVISVTDIGEQAGLFFRSDKVPAIF